MRHAGERRAVEFARSGLCKRVADLLRPLDAAAARENLMEPQDFTWQAPLTGRARKLLIHARSARLA